jgi:enediyne biosynthesis protein E4
LRIAKSSFQMNFYIWITPLVTALGLILCLSHPQATPLSALAQSFAFKTVKLNASHEFSQELRSVGQGSQHLAGWVSALGASLAFSDLDGDGLDNDLCLVDPRTDTVRILALPSSQESPRYKSFSLEMKGSFYGDLMAPLGCLPGDMNEDGHLDLLVYFAGRPPLAFMRVSTMRFEASEVVFPLEAGFQGWVNASATRADLDGDGHADLVLASYFPDSLVLLDAEEQAEIALPDSAGLGLHGGRNRFLLWKKTSAHAAGFRFEEVSIDLPKSALEGWTLSLLAVDLNQDFLPEIYFGNVWGPDQLLVNRSSPGHLYFELENPPHETSSPLSRGLSVNRFKSNAVEFGDWDQDGVAEILIANEGAFTLDKKRGLVPDGIDLVGDLHSSAIVLRSRQVGFETLGWGWDLRLGDFNNDGVAELVQANGFRENWLRYFEGIRNLFFVDPGQLDRPSGWPLQDFSTHARDIYSNSFLVRDGEASFVDLASELRLDSSGNSRAVAIADVDGDGDLDFACANQWQDSYLYLNTSASNRNFLGLNLLYSVHESTKIQVEKGLSSRPGFLAIGAKVHLSLHDEKKVITEIKSGGGLAGQSSTTAFFGLGNLPKDLTVEVEIKWLGQGREPQSKTLNLESGWYTVYLPH